MPPPTVDLFHWRLQPHLQQPEYPTVADASGRRFQELGVGYTVERDDNRMPISTTRLIRIRMRSR
jgi:hypothetical protein